MAQLPTQSQFGDYSEWPGRDVLDSGGQRLGGVREIYLDRETGRPEWVLVDVDGSEARFVPLADADIDSSCIKVAHSASTIRNAPGIGAEPRIDQSEERRLYAHYGLGYSESDSGSGLPTDEPAQQPSGWGAPDADREATTDQPTSTGDDHPTSSAPPSAPEPPPWRADTTLAASEAPWRADPAPEAESAPPTDAAETSAWSDAAEPTNDAPPPGEPPPPDELEAAHTPEPPAASDRPADYDTVTPFDTPASDADSTFEDPAPLDDGPPDAAVIPGLAAAPIPPTPPVAVEPDPVSPPPPSPTPKPTWASAASPPPQPEPAGGLHALVKSRQGRIAVAAVAAAVLLFVIRRLR